LINSRTFLYIDVAYNTVNVYRDYVVWVLYLDELAVDEGLVKV